MLKTCSGSSSDACSSDPRSRTGSGSQLSSGSVAAPSNWGMSLGESGMCTVQGTCRLQGGVSAGVSGLGGVSASTSSREHRDVWTIPGGRWALLTSPRESGDVLNSSGGRWGVSTSPGGRSQLPRPRLEQLEHLIDCWALLGALGWFSVFFFFSGVV